MSTSYHIEPFKANAVLPGEEQTVSTYHIQLAGIVQGVGFRPLAYKLAKQHHVNGSVSNGNDGLHIYVSATEQKAQFYFDTLLSNAPAKAVIATATINKTISKSFIDFAITESSAMNAVCIPITPDYAPCPDCLREMNDKNNRRYQYPFITCTQCGPRYSIIQELPYDRTNTTMQEFSMCTACQEEYNDLHNRRYFSQTNSCNDCGIRLTAKDSEGQIIATGNKVVLNIINKNLQENKIVAVKGIGGYVLLCNAASNEAIQNLRKRKHRPAKPFAVLCSSISEVYSLAACNNLEQKYLQSDAAPIVLLKAKKNITNQIAFTDIAPGLQTIGIMLPGSPLLHLIASGFGKPLICTSGNISGSPIIFEDDEAELHLSPVADIVVSNNRKIVTPQDDSVIRVSMQQQPIILRRARGLAPSLLHIKPYSSKTVLATGALLKSTIAIQHQQQYYVSQYSGSTIGFEAQQYYQQTLQHLTQALQLQPLQNIISDTHPGYFATQLGKNYAAQNNATPQLVQHHKAHLAAVLAENNLLNHPDPILCFIADGTGLGDDKNSWGGEFFKYHNKAITRCYHFDYFPMLLGDKMAAEPRLSALAITYDISGAADLLQQKFTTTEWELYTKMLKNYNGILCSSSGRIFDAVASLLNITDKQSYEGEAAMKLESLALQYLDTVNWQFAESYFTTGAHYNRLPTATLVGGVVTDILKQKDAAYIAAKFHFSLVHCISIIAANLQVKHLAFSGGVFQNAVLVDLINIHLQPSFHLFFHQHLSPNDENISFGQLVYSENNLQ